MGRCTCPRWKLARGLGCGFFVVGSGLVVFGVVVSNLHWKETFSDMKRRLQKGRGGPCQVYNSSSKSSFAYTAATAGTPTAERCASLRDCKCDTGPGEDRCKKTHFEDFDELLWDGDHGIKARHADVNSKFRVSSMSVHETLRGAAVECPCTDPGASVLGKFGAKPHADGTALIKPKVHSDLWKFQWKWGSDGCVLVHWFRGGSEGTTAEAISSKIIGPKGNTDLSLRDWIEAGELDCVVIDADDAWTKDDLFVNTNKEGAIYTLDQYITMIDRYSVGGIVSGAVVLVLSLCSCFLAKWFKSKAEISPQALKEPSQESENALSLEPTMIGA
eukprot:gnl/MRDRNA2_/MRDRNA2_84155_c0_seq1.p1 gnl/MRDRNA2_/MRDRNA2_84155_c0~~gnl/MRDRNA2_/MRDRNA2_84155_c0_seq1.p1  ORF type:complete len:331 (-),score=56.73 gnl/MRDRNA2_/MRDRNA2_84155_c0_seq1:400-1392(-)